MDGIGLRSAHAMSNLMGRDVDEAFYSFMPHDNPVPFPIQYDPCPSCSYKMKCEILEDYFERNAWHVTHQNCPDGTESWAIRDSKWEIIVENLDYVVATKIVRAHNK